VKPQCLVLLVWAMGSSALAQGTRADYDRAGALRRLTQGKVIKSRIEPNWFDSGKRFWYRNDLGHGVSEFIAVDAAAGRREPAFDHAALARALAAAAGKEVEPARLPFTSIEILDKSVIRFRAFDKKWRFDPAVSRIEEEKRTSSPAPIEPVTVQRQRRSSGPGDSPDNKWRALVQNFNLVIRSPEGEDVLLTHDGKADDFYSGVMFWSPDSTRLVAMKTQRGEERKINMVESSPRDQLQPRLHTLTYAKPGDRLTVSRPHLFDVAARKEISIPDALFPSPWSIDRLRWSPDSTEFSFLYNQRGHQELRLVGVDARSGAARAIIDEQSRTFIDYAHKTVLRELPATGEIIWMSERDGWNHLYLYDRKSGKVKNQITRGHWVVRGVEKIDEDKGEILFRASGMDPDQDPYYVHWCRIKFDGSGLVRLTEGDGSHTVRFSPNQDYLIDSWSRVDLPPVSVLRRGSDGKLVCPLEQADMKELLATGWKAPERFAAKGRDGATDIFGVIYRPTNFDPAKKYPIIEDIYAGPQGSFVPKEFSAFRPQQELAELGFIVVQIDGMGTSNRSKAFHDVCCKNLGDSGFPDRILWIKAAAMKYPFMDLTRVGIHGGSAGGQSAARALFAHGDFYKVGVSICGCHDNRMDKVWWNELWMGYPVGPHYGEQSNVTNAHKLTGKLFLIVSELDRNVDPASTMQVVNALIKANKDFDLLVIPGADHGQIGVYGRRRLQDYFVRNLHGVEPRRD
jgi:dipeptidyl-peptidase-4